jgi:hypothetical protein
MDQTPNTEEYIIASVKIPIRLINGGKETIPCQDRCQIELYRCVNLDEFPENNSLESTAIMNKFSQLFAPVPAQPAAPASTVVDEDPQQPPVKEIMVSKKYPSKQKTFRVHSGQGASMRFTRRVYP